MQPRQPAYQPFLSNYWDDEEFYLPKVTLKDKVIKMWAESNRILKIYWDLFRTEYLNFLRERSSAFRQKAGNTQLIPKLDEIVMVKTDNVKINSFGHLLVLLI